MKKTETIQRKSLFARLALVAALIVGSSSVAVADTVIVDGSNINDGWATGQVASTSNKVDIPGENSISTTGAFTNSTTYLAGYKYTWYALYSTQKVSISSGQKFIIGAQGMGSTSAKLCLKYSSTSQTDNSSFTAAETFTTELQSSSLQANFTDLIVDNIPDGEYYIQIISKAVNINSVILTAPTTTIDTPLLDVSPTAVVFGSCRAIATETVTVTNTGVGSMDVTIGNDNTTDFTVSATSLTDIGAGESKTFDVTFNYDAANLGDKRANITVTPSYDAADAKVISLTATAADATVWEDFDSGIPSTWYNENDSWLNYVSGLSGYASPGYQSSDILRTPRLYAEEGQALGFDVKIVGTYSSNVVTAKYSTDRVNWSSPVTYSADGTYTIVAPATGYYWVEFTASQAGIDNMTGWTIAETIHDTKLGTATIPATGTAHGDYTASVVVKELGGSTETVNAELYFGTEKVAEQTGIALGGNRDVTVTFTYLPTETFSGDVYIKVFGTYIGTLETDKVAVEISETPYVFDENSDVNPVISSNSVVKVKYTAQKGWNTIVMPFALSGSPTYLDIIFGEDWTAYTIGTFNEGVVTFNQASSYSNRKSLSASTPLLIYAPNAESHPDGVYLQNVSAGSYFWTHSNINQTKGDITFKGTFAPIAAPEMTGKYGITDKGTVAKGGSSASIKAYRAYLELAPSSTARSLTLVIDNESGTTTAIGELVKTLEGDNGQQVYNLSGQRVEKAKKGLYIVGGKKVIVK